jgi:hypothetical protein
MKKITFLLLCSTAFIACTRNTDGNDKNKIVLAENIQSITSLVPDSAWDENAWNALYKYDQVKLFNTIVKGVTTGKLKAYSDISEPKTELTTEEFSRIIVAWDSTARTEDPNKPGTFIIAPIKMELTGDDIVQLRFNEKIEMDTVSYTLHRTASSVAFISYMRSDAGEIVGLKHLFDVKLDNAQAAERKH